MYIWSANLDYNESEKEYVENQFTKVLERQLSDYTNWRMYIESFTFIHPEEILLEQTNALGCINTNFEQKSINVYLKLQSAGELTLEHNLMHELGHTEYYIHCFSRLDKHCLDLLSINHNSPHNKLINEYIAEKFAYEKSNTTINIEPADNLYYLATSFAYNSHDYLHLKITPQRFAEISKLLENLYFLTINNGDYNSDSFYISYINTFTMLKDTFMNLY